MQQEYYKYQYHTDSLWFEFLSVSNLKTVKKVVTYTPFQDSREIFNLGFADALPDGSFSDTNVTNNDDMEKVFATIIRTILHFFEKYPDKMIYITGSTPVRTRLYRIIILRELSKIEDTFRVLGLSGSVPEVFQKNQNYQAFVISLRSKTNLLKLLYENNR